MCTLSIQNYTLKLTFCVSPRSCELNIRWTSFRHFPSVGPSVSMNLEINLVLSDTGSKTVLIFPLRLKCAEVSKKTSRSSRPDHSDISLPQVLYRTDICCLLTVTSQTWVMLFSLLVSQRKWWSCLFRVSTNFPVLFKTIMFITLKCSRCAWSVLSLLVFEAYFDVKTFNFEQYFCVWYILYRVCPQIK